MVFAGCHQRFGRRSHDSLQRRLHLESLACRALPSLLGNQLFPSDNPWNQQSPTTGPGTGNAALIVAASSFTGGAGMTQVFFGNTPATA